MCTVLLGVELGHVALADEVVLFEDLLEVADLSGRKRKMIEEEEA
jgi:hypothetical protein